MFGSGDPASAPVPRGCPASPAPEGPLVDERHPVEPFRVLDQQGFVQERLRPRAVEDLEPHQLRLHDPAGAGVGMSGEEDVGLGR